MNHESVTYLWF